MTGNDLDRLIRQTFKRAIRKGNRMPKRISLMTENMEAIKQFLQSPSSPLDRTPLPNYQWYYQCVPLDIYCAGPTTCVVETKK